MPTLSTRVSDGEFNAITEYANSCGLSVSDLIKKILVYQICWLWVGCPEDKYHEQMYYTNPLENIDADEEVTKFVNKFRSSVGIRPLKVGEF